MSDKDSLSRNNESINEKEKYSGPREVIFVSGWANINTIYNNYLIGFISKIILGIIIILTFLYWNKNLIYIMATLMVLAICHIINNIVQIVKLESNNIKFKMMYWVDLALCVGYATYFLGFILAIMELIP